MSDAYVPAFHDHGHLARAGYLPVATVFGAPFFVFERIPWTTFGLVPPRFSVRLALSDSIDLLPPETCGRLPC